MSDDRTIEQKPRLSPSEQMEWAAKNLQAAREGEAVFSQSEVAEVVADQRAAQPVYRDHAEAAEAMVSKREDAREHQQAQEHEQRQRAAREAERDAQEMRFADEVTRHLPDAQADYQTRYQELVTRAEAIKRIEDPHAQAAALQMLQTEATQVHELGQNLERGALVQEQKRLHGLRPALKNEKTRGELVSWAKQRFGYTDADIASADTRTILAHFDAWQSELKTAADSKAAAEAPDPGPMVHERPRWHRNEGRYQTLDQMHTTLERTGDIDDALAIMAARRTEAQANG